MILGLTQQAARIHADAALPYIVGDGYLVAQWLACYGVLKIS